MALKPLYAMNQQKIVSIGAELQIVQIQLDAGVCGDKSCVLKKDA